MAGKRAARRRSGDGVEVDDIDREIIEILQRDGRCPNTRIAEQVGLSESAIRQRVQRLLDLRVMQIVAVTDPMQLGLRRMAMIGIRVDGDIEPVVDKLAGFDEVDYVVICAGSFDLVIEVVVQDDDHLLRLLTNDIRSIDGVRSTETFVYLKLHKQTYSWGTT